MRHAKAFVFAAVAGMLAAGSLEAQTATGTVRWMGVNGAWGSYSNFPDGSGTRWNVYTSPYRAQFSIPSDVPHDWHLPLNGGSSFGPTQDIFCVDFNHYANTGTYSAFFTNLGTSSANLGVYTRGSTLQTYLAAAYLAQEVKLHPSQAGILNGAIWQIMSGQPNYWWNGSAWADVAPTAAYALNTGYKSVRADEWVVVTEGFVDASHDRIVLGNSQEYITHVTPEPATLLLLGTGLVVLLMATRSTSGSSVLAGPAYAIAILFVLLPIIDTFSQTWPLAFSNPGWRYGTIGIGANYLISVLLGALGLSALAAAGQRRGTLRSLAVLDGIATLVLLVAVIGFLLDAVQVRSGIPAGEVGTRRTFDIGAAKAAFKYVLSAVVLAWLAFASWKRASAARRDGDESVPALVGERRR